MKIQTHAILLALCCILVWAILPVNASAETEGLFTYTVTNAEATITGCAQSATGEIIIPDTLGGYPVTVIGTRAFSNRKQITGIIFPDSVTTLEYAAFEQCTALREIVWPNNLKSIGNSAFSQCTSLTEVILPNSVSTLGESAFLGCTGLQRIALPSGITEVLYRTFYYCTALSDVIIPKSVKKINYQAFYSSNKIATIHYQGTEAEWSNVTVSGFNSSFPKATLSYNYQHICMTPKKFTINGVEKIRVTTTNIPADGELISVCFDGNRMVYFQPATVIAGQINYDFTPNCSYSQAKVMAWSSLDSLVPILNSIPVE